MAVTQCTIQKHGRDLEEKKRVRKLFQSATFPPLYLPMAQTKFWSQNDAPTFTSM